MGDSRGISLAHVRVDASQHAPLRRIWRYVGYDEVNCTYTPHGRLLLGKLGSLSDGPYFVRAHYLLCSGDGTGRPKWGSTNVYTEDTRGHARYTWELIDRVLDAYLERGCVPFVELGFMPEALSIAPEGTCYDTLLEGGWRYPPKDYGRWQDLMRAMAEHCLQRYGLREVGRWYWELWNEPDIFYWAGSTEEYCRLYDHTVAGIVDVLPQASVGGPATTNPDFPRAGEFLRRFLDHCVRGRNAVTGGEGTRLDFISFHTKGANYRRETEWTKQTPTIHRLVHNVVTGLDIAAEFPELAGREIILSECDPDGMAAYGKHDNPNLVFRNTEYYASYLATAVCEMINLLGPSGLRVDGLLTWAFQFEGREYFEGLRTLSSNGIDKPVLNVFRMLGELGGLRLGLQSDAARDLSGQAGPDTSDMSPRVTGLAASDGVGSVQVLLTSHHDDWDIHTSTEIELDITGLETGRCYRVERYLIDAEHSNAHTTWLGMGQPGNPSADQLRALYRAGELHRVQESILSCHGGHLRATLTLLAHSVCLYRLSLA
jgi:xylan 1,4-beta-xylosidase